MVRARTACPHGSCHAVHTPSSRSGIRCHMHTHQADLDAFCIIEVAHPFDSMYARPLCYIYAAATSLAKPLDLYIPL